MLIDTTQLEAFLALPELDIVSLIRRGNENGFDVRCKKNTDFEVCPKCASKSHSIKDHVEVRIKDAPLRGADIFLVISKRRFRCYQCHSVFTEYVPGISKGKRTTERYRKYVAQAAEHFSNLEEARQYCGCSTGYLYKTHYEILEKKLETDKAVGQPRSVLMNIL